MKQVNTSLSFSQICDKHGICHEAMIEALADGTEKELKNTPDLDIARKIALDNLGESADYYKLHPYGEMYITTPS